MNLKETCQNTDAEWEERQKARAEELEGCSEALAILSSDDAHDTFTRTFNFVQAPRGFSSTLFQGRGNHTAAALELRARLRYIQNR